MLDDATVDATEIPANPRAVIDHGFSCLDTGLTLLAAGLLHQPS